MEIHGFFFLFFLIFTLLLPSQSAAISPCASRTFSSNRVFSTCAALPHLSASLHWTLDPSTSLLSLAFAAPAPSDGWLAWAVNPTADGMIGSQTLIAFRGGHSGAVVVKTYNITSYGPVKGADRHRRVGLGGRVRGVGDEDLRQGEAGQGDHEGERGVAGGGERGRRGAGEARLRRRQPRGERGGGLGEGGQCWRWGRKFCAQEEEYTWSAECSELGDFASAWCNHRQVPKDLQVGRSCLVLSSRLVPAHWLCCGSRRLGNRSQSWKQIEGNSVHHSQKHRHHPVCPRHCTTFCIVSEAKQGPQVPPILEHLPPLGWIHRHRAWGCQRV
ncbi:deSI-like proteinisoform X1 [Iris pallida]|uniref:DeSI-like proteinisoform X1 n=1 Tax=Iris pallida TaxID=29817 RepID=A0AAX6G841_IRIPA|nr:deSI-like proteinisoform X1 [Iris pallida]